jgi:hypothetical protein
MRILTFHFDADPNADPAFLFGSGSGPSCNLIDFPVDFLNLSKNFKFRFMRILIRISLLYGSGFGSGSLFVFDADPDPAC